jgi:hypothetical protein
MLSRPRRRCTGLARVDDLPVCSWHRLHSGPAHHGLLLAECFFCPRDTGTFKGVSRWVREEVMATSPLVVVVTFASIQGRWQPITVARESIRLQEKGITGQYGLFVAVDKTDGECVGAMSDGVKVADTVTKANMESMSDAQREFACELGAHNPTGKGLFDCSSCRDGGPKRANSPQGLTPSANAALWGCGLLCVLPGKTIPALRADDPQRVHARSEILWEYGPLFRFAE